MGKPYFIFQEMVLRKQISQQTEVRLQRHLYAKIVKRYAWLILKNKQANYCALFYNALFWQYEKDPAHWGVVGKIGRRG